MPQAARLADPIGHSPSMNWLLAGVVAGAAIAVAGVAIVGTGGLAAAAIVGGAAAMGGGLGETLSTMSWAPKEVCGTISNTGSNNVFINNRPAARAHVDFTVCGKHSGPPLPIAVGSATVLINGQPAARVDDLSGCGALITSGSGNVYIGGSSLQTDIVNPEDLIPAWMNGALVAAGIGSAAMLGGWVLAIGGLAGGLGGGLAGAWTGEKLFGKGSDGQKWAALGGGLLGGVLGARGSSSALRLLSKPRGPLTVSPQPVAKPPVSDEIQALRRIAAANTSAKGAIFNARISLKPYVLNGDVMGLMDQLDVSTAGKPTGFWSGNLNAAMGEADAGGVALLETTPGGRIVNEWQFLNKKLPWKTGGEEFWTGISGKYAAGSQGEVFVWQSPDRALSANGTLDWRGGYVWQTAERPVIQQLQDNGIVTGIKYQLVEPTGPNAPARWH